MWHHPGGAGLIPERYRSTPPTLTVVCVSARDWFRHAVRDAVAALTDDSGRDLVVRPPEPVTPAPAGPPATAAAAPAEYVQIVAHARRYLDRHLPSATIRLVHAADLGGVPAALTPADTGAEPPALLLVDAGDTPRDGQVGPVGPDAVEAALRAWPEAVRPELSPYGVYVYQQPVKPQIQPVVRYTLRQSPTEPWVLAADVICALTDHVEVRRVRPAMAAEKTQDDTTLAVALHAFLTARAGARWGLWSYTGSVVSSLIADLERRAAATGNPVLRGPSEHSLASGALARWLLDDAPFLIVVTSGMVDEFRGTLADLRQAGARGFIVTADSAEDRWYPFQGTVHADEDSREVLRARRLPAFHLARAGDLPTDLAAAFAAYDADEGPVVLLATPSVLDSRQPAPRIPPAPPALVPAGRDHAPVGPAPRVEVGPGDPVEPVIRMLNDEPVTLLWQVGALPAADADLLHEAARRSGAALADSLTRPGTVAHYRDGAPVPHYLGTLGLYGFSSRVLDYLHADGHLRPKGSQCLFFLGSRIAEVSTPFSPRTLRQQLRVVQVTRRAAHLAPFADHPIHSDLRGFLRRVLDRLDVDPAVLELRHRAIAAARPTVDPLALLPVRPMTSNYFFHRLDAVVRGLIEEADYRYTGVYDVGRGGAAAVRNVARTGPGLSGWYGRALMGDALQAIPTIAVTRPGNVLAFIGDGAAALVPDILPVLLQQIHADGHRLRGNLSIFTLLNGGHSMIRTYRETRHREPGGGQTTVVNLLDDDWSRTIGPVRVSHRTLEDVDADRLRAELTLPGVVNLYSVLLGHNNEGDGLSLLAARSWHAGLDPGAGREAGPLDHGRRAVGSAGGPAATRPVSARTNGSE